MTLGEILERELERLHDRYGEELALVETGCIRGDTPEFEEGDGWSTVTLAKFVRDHPASSLTSIDLDVSVARKVLAELELLSDRIALVEGDSVEVLAELLEEGEGADLILLDSANDAQLILHEFFIARHLLTEHGVLLIDDAEPGSDAVKGNDVIDWLTKEDEVFELVPRTGTVYSTNVLIWKPND